MNLLLKNLLLSAFFLICQVAIGQTNQTIKSPALVQKLKTTQGLVAFWDFKEKEGHARKAWGMGNFFKGLIGGLAVFNRALTDEEILQFKL
jgi:hypothetical protein